MNLALTERMKRNVRKDDNHSKRNYVSKVRDGPQPSPSPFPASPFPTEQSTLAWHPFLDFPREPVCLSYLGLGTARLSQTLTGHLNCLVCTGKLCGLHQPLLSSLTVGVRDANQVCSLRREKFEGEE